MRILLVHNHYQQPGGEDAVFEAEKALLEQMGHEVIPFVEDNARLNGMNPLKAAQNAIWSREARNKLRRLIRETKPDVAHFHNTFLMISPAAYYACKEAGVPVVQTVQNYRLFCPAATFMRDGRVCEDCLGKIFPWPGVLHGCWRGRMHTAVVATMLTVHRMLRTWHQQVDIFVPATNFGRRKLIEGGIPEHKIVVKPNFLYPDPGRGDHKGNFALFVGRFSPEKGILTLLGAWERLRARIPLKLVGDGPLLDRVRTLLRSSSIDIDLLGWRSREEVLTMMKSATVLLFPSQWYEGFPVTIVEALSCGLPILASRLGAMAEIVEDGRTGLLFRPGDPEELANKVEWAWTHPQEIEEMRREARREYEERYSAEQNYRKLIEIYQMARDRAKRR